MALIEVNAEFKLLVKQLIRIADALERAWPPVFERKYEQISDEDFIHVTDEKLWLKEQEELEKQQNQSEDQGDRKKGMN